VKVRVRAARANDKKPLMSFIKNVWGGHDYIPRVWDDWLKDRNGRMFVVEVGGVPVGMNRVRFLEDGSAWFEGARVHPNFRGMGLASKLGVRTMRVARNQGIRVFRLVSGSRNRSAHRQIARMRFKETSRISVYVPGKGARFVPEKGVSLAAPDDLERVMRLVKKSREFKLGSGVFWDSFAAKSLDSSMVKGLIRDQSVWIKDESVAIAKVGREEGIGWRQVCFLAGNDDGPLKLVSHVFGLKVKGRTSLRLVYMPQGSRMIGILRRSGFVRWSSLILFQRTAAKG